MFPYPVFVWAGLSLSEIKLEDAGCYWDERIYWFVSGNHLDLLCHYFPLVFERHCMLSHFLCSNNCRTSIADFLRSCPSCSYDLCLICCREIRESHMQGGKTEVTMEYIDKGIAYMHGDHASSKQQLRSQTLDIPVKETGSKNHSESVKTVWKAQDNGSIPCPQENMGGCGKGILKLKRTFPEYYVSKLLLKAEAIAKIYKLEHMG